MNFFSETKLIGILADNDFNEFKKLVQSYGVNSTSKYGRNFLNYTIVDNKMEFITYLLSIEDIDINFKEEDSGFTALHFAIQEENKEAFELLLKQPNIQIDIQDSWGNTPLWRGIMNEADEDMIIVLLEKGADINLKNNSDVAPIDLLDEALPKIEKWVENNK